MALSARKEDLSSNTITKSKFELQYLTARAFIPSVVRVEPHIYPGRIAYVEETEGMTTPTEERGDLTINNI